MIFNSIEYFIFFSAVVVLFYVTPGKLRIYLLLAASVYFYAYLVPQYILLISVTIVNDYFIGRLINSKPVRKRIFLIESIVLNVLILFTFKYFNFFNVNVERAAGIIGWNYSAVFLEIALPIGLSFYIFKSLSYVIEVYRGNQEPEKNFFYYALYVLFFPELLAGPIDRPQNLLHQFHEVRSIDYIKISNGLKLIAWGLLKKVVIADRLAVLVNFVFGNIRNYEGIPLIIAVVFFAFQIYCDFSGYSDIAIGSGMVLGFDIPKNFNKPYFSKSISEFWRRWHITFSFWLRDYLFLPVAYWSVRKFSSSSLVNKLNLNQEKLSYILAVMITFFIAGLWHGAGWTYITWGMLIGVFLITSFLTKKLRLRFMKLLRINKVVWLQNSIRVILTFSLICVSWLFFRANSISDALYALTHFFTSFTFKFGGYNMGRGQFQILLSFIFIILLIISEYLFKDLEFHEYISQRRKLIRRTVYYAIITIIIVFGEFGGSTSFIYFKF